jgi:hypothetical protein
MIRSIDRHLWQWKAWRMRRQLPEPERQRTAVIKEKRANHKATRADQQQLREWRNAGLRQEIGR